MIPITYCTNIHPGDSWAEHAAQLQACLPRIKAAVSPSGTFPVGLRLSARAAAELSAPATLRNFRGFLAHHDLSVPTLNGFPFGAFHGAAVKDRAYLPDWRDPARLTYTRTLAEILDQLLPEGATGSISTVPGAYLPHLSGKTDVDAIAINLIRSAVHLFRLSEVSGRTIILALEPEPGCLLETIDETLAFFRSHLFAEDKVALMAAMTGLSRPQAEEALRRHLGVCLDACHLAVSFEPPLRAVNRLLAEGIVIAKLQVSNALSFDAPHGAERLQLHALADPVWLHQVRVRHRTGVRSYGDLPQALQREFAAATEWRVHLHVPVWCERFGPFGTTAGTLRELLDRQAAEAFTSLLEVETYCWDLLPADWRGTNVADSIIKEIAWTQERSLAAATA